MRVLALVNLLTSAFSLRQRRKAGAWTTTTDHNTGVCAEHIKHVRKDTPVNIPLLCSGKATDLTFAATAYGYLNPTFTLVIDGEKKGSKKWPIFGGTRKWEVSVDSLSAGLHQIKYFGNVDLKSVQLTGKGAASCSFELAPGYAEERSSSTYSGFDVINNLFGAKANFSEFKKKQLHFSQETLGTNADGSISSTVVSDGLWRWVYEYSQKQAPNDLWLSGGKMWDESDIMPYENIPLGQIRGRSGQDMVVQEPCNALSNLAFHETAVWITCKDLSFDRDDMASLMAAFNGLAAGSFFLHACSCSTGGKADNFPMDWMMLQIYQIMVKNVLVDAGDRLTQAEKSVVEKIGHDIKAVDMAKDMTRLFSEKYDHAHWNATLRAIDIPKYEMSIASIVVFVLYGLEGKLPIPGLETLLNSLITALMDLFDLPDKDFFLETYIPAVKKALSFSKMCTSAIMPIVEHMLKFALTFVEAFVFQEKVIPVPKPIREIVGVLDRLGVTSDLLSDMKPTWDYYNGFDCKVRSDHATWHEKASHGLVHISIVADEFLNNHNC